ncbi:MAG: HyaD/HybD family hydrogenase maturation endopeptidase [Desulfobacteraceae bacterium]|jgi:hydrogenase maturation protease
MDNRQITILGVGNYLYTDEGVGIRVIEKLEQDYEFPEHVIPVDGGVLGVHLMGVISAADHLIVVDAVRNNGAPGTLYRLAGKDIPSRILAKNSLHQVDLLEALTLVKAIDRSPETVIVGIEPEDIETMSLTLTKTVAAKVDDLIAMVLAELDSLNVTYSRRNSKN